MEQSQELARRIERFGMIWARLNAALDWVHLGRLYCSEGGDEFFCEEQREELLDSGLTFAQELGTRLGEAPSGQSLYLGAAIFELCPALFENLVLGRRVVLVNLDQDETTELNRALELVAADTKIALPRIDVCELREFETGAYDHLWMTSILTDPEAFPALHDLLYEREGSELATNHGDVSAERELAARLVAELFDRATAEFWLTTTDEELDFVRAECETRELEIAVPETGRLSGIVGDPVLHCQVSSAASA